MTFGLSILHTWPRPRAQFWLAFFGRPSGPIGWVGAHVMPFVSGRLNEKVATELDLHPDDDVLDVGCGSGGFLQHIAARGCHVAGLDASEIQVEMARQRLRDQIDGGTAEVVLGNADTLPWGDGRFDAVASLNCLKFVADPDQVLVEMYRVLRAGGRAVILVDMAVPDMKSRAINAYGEWQWSADDAKHLMDRAGFVDTSVTQLTATYYWLQLVRAAMPT
jgi:ubiquinone/menaquinone biosynthesis C-methylase UbiE